ncbi:MAG: methyltransferase domain-containing protein [Thermoguttaceae bacterium]|nr:methyltransferase domain-containing protein [Thermoguttaceae bacterium]
MSTQPFNDLSDVYEAMIDWPKRLANEEPFYRRVFGRVGARRLLDVACGTGHHAAHFHRWGLHVEGADVSPNMIERARARFGEPDGLRWLVRAFDQPAVEDEPFDVAICIGNSLSLAPDHRTVERALGEMIGAIRPGGLAVVHVLNLWQLPDGPCQWQKCQRTCLRGGDVLIVKGVHRAGNRGYVDLVVADPGGRMLHNESAPLLGLEAAELEAMVRRAGARAVEFFGGYRDQPYERPTSIDLVMVAEK